MNEDAANEILNVVASKVKLASEKASSDTSEEVLAQKKMQFDNYGANDWDNDQFPALEPSTVRRKGGNDKPLLRTGRLRDHLFSPDDDDFFSVSAQGVTDENGHYYADKARDYIDRKGGTHYFDELSEEEADSAVDFYVDRLVDRLA